MTAVAGLLVALTLLQVTPPAVGPPATGVIRGRITDADTGQPLARASVQLMLPSFQRQLRTDVAPDGTYEFTGLAPGSYNVWASAGAHMAAYVPAGPGGPMLRPARANTIVLRAGEIRDVHVKLQRARAISGRVVDETGEPLAAVPLKLFRSPGGQPGGRLGPDRATDDQGEFRLFGIPPGEYFVCAEPPHQPDVRDPAVGTRSRLVRTTCHPSSTDDSLGRPVVVGSSDVEGIEIRLTRVESIAIRGVVLDVEGKPARGAQLMLQRRWRGHGSGTGTSLGDDGTFTMSGIVPGKYTIAATLRGDTTAGQGEAQAAFLDVDLSSDQDGLVVTLAPPARVRGRFVFEGGPPPDGAAPGITVRSTLPFGTGGNPRTELQADGSFVTSGFFGAVTFRVDRLPAGWVVKGIHYRGADITDVPTEMRTGPDELSVVLTNRPAALIGRVVDTAGQVVAGARVVLLPADKAAWPGLERRWVTLTGDSGRFTIGLLRPGEYLVVALSGDEYDDLGALADPSVLAAAGRPVTLGENEQRSLDVPLASLSRR